MYNIHQSWKDLDAKENEDFYLNWIEKYHNRIMKLQEYAHIPKQVFHQWIYELHDNNISLKNYAWMDYKNIRFELEEWSFEKLKDISIVSEAEFTLSPQRLSISEFKNFPCKKEDMEYRKIYWTWRVPPIILDVNTIKSDIPLHAEIKWSYQLIEWHNRFSYLFIVKNMTNKNRWQLAKTHKVYVMKEV